MTRIEGHSYSCVTALQSRKKLSSRLIQVLESYKTIALNQLRAMRIVEGNMIKSSSRRIDVEKPICSRMLDTKKWALILSFRSCTRRFNCTNSLTQTLFSKTENGQWAAFSGDIG